MRLCVRRGSVLRIALLLGLLVEVLLPSGALLAAAPAASVVVPPHASMGHDAVVADSLRHAHGASPRATAGSPLPSTSATPAGTPAAAASTPVPLPQAHHHPHPLLASNAGAVGETITVPFTEGTTGVSTAQSYLGPVTITVSGVGQADGSNYSDAFYVYEDGQGNPINPPEHFGPPGYFYTWMLWINGGPSDVYVPHYPAYTPAHVYVFTIVAPGGSLNFAVGDTLVSDNTGAYTVTVTRPSGTIPWHPHHTVRVSDHLSASVDLADGHVDVSASDLSIPGRGPDLNVTHVWDSALAEDALTSTAGQGWVNSLTPSMSGILTQTVFFNDQTGATWPFSIYRRHCGDRALYKLSDAGWPTVAVDHLQRRLYADQHPDQ